MKLNIKHEDVVRARKQRAWDFAHYVALGYLAGIEQASLWRWVIWSAIALHALVALGNIYLAHQRLDEDPL